MTTDFDKLIDQALMEFSSRNELHIDDDTQAINDLGYTELIDFLEEIDTEDTNLADSEISTVEFIENNRDEEDGENSLADSLMHDEVDWFNKTNWEIDADGNFVKREKALGIKEESDSSAIEPHTETEEERQARIRASIEAWQNGFRRYYHNKELRKIEINRMAFDQNILPLSETVSNEHKRLLIETLTEPIRKLIRTYEDYINMRITKLLLPAIPSPLKLANIKWPWTFIQNPGFIYKTHPKFGKVISFYANPKIPYYFKQGSEQSILEERDAALTHFYLDRVDRTVHKWNDAKESLADKEVRYAMKLVYMKGNTYYHLLVLNPFWFETLYKKVKEDGERAAADLL